MLNNVILVGRLTKSPELKELPDGKNVANLTIAVNRPFKNQETNEYDTDFIQCTLWNAVALSAYEYCKKGSTIGIKGRLVNRDNEIKEVKFQSLELIAEHITFISSQPKKEKE